MLCFSWLPVPEAAESADFFCKEGTPVSKPFFSFVRRVAWGLLLAGVPALSGPHSAIAQSPHYRINKPVNPLDLTLNTRRILTLEYNVPKFLVNKEELVKVNPLSPNQLQVWGLKPGITQLNVWDEKNNVYVVEIRVQRDVSELQDELQKDFPRASIRISPNPKGVTLRGYAPSGEMASQIAAVAKTHFEEVLNLMTVGNGQQITLHAKVLEVSRTKLRALGLDWSAITSDFVAMQGVSGLLGQATTTFGQALVPGQAADTIRLGYTSGSSEFFAYLEALEQRNVVKTRAEPNLTVTSGRPASFWDGGEFPIPVPAGNGVTGVTYRNYGVQMDALAVVLDNDKIRLDIRPSVSERDTARGVTLAGVTVPGISTRGANTSVVLRAGQTMALAGLIQNRVEAQVRAVPWLGSVPILGNMFRRQSEQVNEIELLILITPQLAAPLDAEQSAGVVGPGQTSASPTDKQLYLYGFLERPACCPNGTCANCQANAHNRAIRVHVSEPASFTEPQMYSPHGAQPANHPSPTIAAPPNHSPPTVNHFPPNSAPPAASSNNFALEPSPAPLSPSSYSSPTYPPPASSYTPPVRREPAPAAAPARPTGSSSRPAHPAAAPSSAAPGLYGDSGYDPLD